MLKYIFIEGKYNKQTWIITNSLSESSIILTNKQPCPDNRCKHAPQGKLATHSNGLPVANSHRRDTFNKIFFFCCRPHAVSPPNNNGV